MVNKRKLVRDVVIVLIILVGAFFLLRSRQPGPADVTGGTKEADASDLPPGHMGDRPEISEGEAYVTIGDKTIGKTWFDNEVKIQAAQLEASQKDAAQGQEMGGMGGGKMTPEQIDKFARLSVLIAGLDQIIEDKAIKDWNIQPDQKLLEEERTKFNAEFKSPDEADAFLAKMGMTKERLEQLWTDDSIHKALEDKVAVESGVEPGSDQASEAFTDWILAQIKASKMTFADPELEKLYTEYASAVESGQMGQGSAVESEGSAVKDEGIH